MLRRRNEWVDGRARDDYRSPGRHGWLIIGVMVVMGAIGATDRAHAAGTFYVDGASPACSDAGPGTSATPYCTISAAVTAQHGPGVTILVRPAVYREEVVVPASGLSGSPFIIQGQGSPVVVDGADDFSNVGVWNVFSGNVYVAPTVNWPVQQVFVDGQRLTPSTAAPGSLPSGSFSFVFGSGLYVNVGGGNPGTHQTLVGHRANGFRLSGRSFVTIDNFTITHADDKGIYLANGSNNTTITHNAVDHCAVYGIQASNSSNVLIGSNTVSDNGDHGIVFSTVSNSTIQDNESFRNARASARAANGVYVFSSPGTLIQRNRWHDNQDTGEQFQTGSNNCISLQNRSWNNGDHGYDHLNSSGTMHINDVAWGNHKDGFSIEGNATGTNVINCIAVDNGLTTSEFDLWVDSGSSSGLVSNYNIFWNSNAQPPIKFIATQYSTIAAFTSVSGQDAQSIQADPKFVNPAAGDFHVLATSPAIDDANSSVANWPATDAEGQARVDVLSVPNNGIGPVAYADRGALEFVGLPPVAALSASPASGKSPLLVNLDASGSRDPDGVIVSYLFDFGDGQLAGPQSSATAVHAYTTGTWTARVTVTDNSGLTASATATITALNDRPPVVSAPANLTVNENAAVTVNVTATDPDGDSISSLTADLSGLPAGNNAVFTSAGDNGSGTLTWTPTFSDSRAAPYTVTFRASNALSGTASTAIQVNNADAPPVVTAPATATINENSQLTVNITASDPDGNPITSLTADLSAFPAGSNAQFTPGAGNLTGRLRWTPTYRDGRVAPYVVTFRASNALSGSASTAIQVHDVPHAAPAVSAPGNVSGNEGAVITVNVTALDADGDSITSLTADLSALPAGSNASFTAAPGNTSGTLRWIPTYFDARGAAYPVTFRASNALSGTASTSITVRNVDGPPQITAPSAVSGNENNQITVDITVVEPDGQAITTLTADLSGLPAGNNATFVPGAGNASGRLTWTPTLNDARPSPYVVSFRASNAQTGTASTSITVNETDRPPVVTAPVNVSGNENSLMTFQVTASDPDGQPISALTADLSGLPAGNGASFVPSAGNTTGTFSWTPSFDAAGSYMVTWFTAAGGLSATAATTITVNNVDRAPTVSAPPSVVVNENASATIQVSAADPDGQPITLLTANLSGLPAGNNAVFTAGPGNTGGTLAWTPTYDDGLAGPYVVSFRANNALSGTASTSIAVRNVDRPPVVSSPPSVSVDEYALVTVHVTVTDPDGDPMSFLSADFSGLPAGNNAMFTPDPGNLSGTMTWNPTFNDSRSTPYVVRFDAGNGGSASSTTAITVRNRDRAPIVSARPGVSVNEGSTLSLQVTAVDPDGEPISSLSADLTGLPSGSNAVFTPAADNTSGTVVWTPTLRDAGSYRVNFRAANALAGTAATTIQVVNVNRSPVVTTPGTVDAHEGRLVVLNVSVSDPDGDPIGSLTADLSELPPGNDAVFTTGPDNTTGTLSWTPRLGEAGSYGVTFTASDQTLAAVTLGRTIQSEPVGAVAAPIAAPLSRIAVVRTVTMNGSRRDDGQSGDGGARPPDVNSSSSRTVIVLHPDHPPVVTAPDVIKVSEGDPISLHVTAADPDGDAITSLTADLTALPVGSNAAFVAEAGNGGGTLTWTPRSGDGGSYSVTFTASNVIAGSTQTTIVVHHIDRPPVVSAPSTVTGAEGSPITIQLAVSDPDGDAIASLTADTSALPSQSGPVFTSGDGNNSGTLSWTPGFGDAGTYTVTFTAANALSASATTMITVNHTDRPPVVIATAAKGQEGTAITMEVTASDPDGDAITSLSADLSTLPAANNAVFDPGPGNTSGRLTWTPTFNDAGTYEIVFRAHNVLDGSAQASLTVSDVNRAPEVRADAAIGGLENTQISITVGASDPDGEGIAALAADLTALPHGNTAVFTPGPGNTSGSLTWTPGFADAGAYTVTFTASNGLSGSAQTTITVGNLDRPPVVSAATEVVGHEDGQITLAVTATDPDGDPIGSLSVDLTGLPSDAAASFSPDSTNGSGTMTWTPGFNDAGTYHVTFMATNALKGAATTTIDVQNVDRPPVVGPVSLNAGPTGGPITVRVSASDPDGDAIRSLTADLSGLPEGNDAVFAVDGGNDAGTLTWAPAPGDTGTYVVNFTASNELSGTAKATIDVPFHSFAHGPIALEGGHGSPGSAPSGADSAGVAAGTGSTPPGLAPGLVRMAPNPMPGSGAIEFTTAKAGEVRVWILDVNGRQVRHVLNEAWLSAGYHRVEIDGRDDMGRRLPPATYFYRVQTPLETRTGRFVLMR